MIFYKILAFFLIGSPIIIFTPELYFPYSYLGLVLFFLADWFSYKSYFPIVNFLFLDFCFLAIIMKKPLSYQLMIQIFMILQYINYSIFIPKLNSFFYIGIFLTIVGFLVPIIHTINTFLLGFILLFYMIFSLRQAKKLAFSLNKTEKEKILIEDDNDEDLLIQEQIIPLETLEIQEIDYVIPLNTEEPNK